MPPFSHRKSQDDVLVKCGLLNLTTFIPLPRPLQADASKTGSQSTALQLKKESNCKTEPSSPQQSAAEDQTEPVDLSLNKPRSSSHAAVAATTATTAASVTVNPAPNPAVSQPGLSATPVPSGVQSIGSMVSAKTTYTNIL